VSVLTTKFLTESAEFRRSCDENMFGVLFMGTPCSIGSVTIRRCLQRRRKSALVSIRGKLDQNLYTADD